jgi:HJR/Mrr/RecB family endonuclease
VSNRARKNYLYINQVTAKTQSLLRLSQSLGSGRLLERFGWQIEPMGYTKDDGIDIIAIRKIMPDIDIRMMIQCKRFSPGNTVGVEFVKQLWATKVEHGFHQAMLATTSSFTKGAMIKADLWKLELRDHQSMVDWCMKYGEARKTGKA